MTDAILRPCLCCNKVGAVKRDYWMKFEAPAALCMGCLSLIIHDKMPWPMVQMLYLLRCQVASLRSEAEIQNKNINRLFTAQQELEQELLKKTRPTA